MASITINGITVDPDTQQEDIAATGLSAADVETANRLLVQTEQPLEPEVRQQLSDLGLRVQEYVSDNTYLATGEDAVVLESVRSIPGVRWADVTCVSSRSRRRCSRRASSRRTCRLSRTLRPRRRAYRWRSTFCCTPTSYRTKRSSSGWPR